MRRTVYSKYLLDIYTLDILCTIFIVGSTFRGDVSYASRRATMERECIEVVDVVQRILNTPRSNHCNSDTKKICGRVLWTTVLLSGGW
jgi:hypothetical protein